jgi:hypothetical protein
VAKGCFSAIPLLCSSNEKQSGANSLFHKDQLDLPEDKAENSEPSHEQTEYFAYSAIYAVYYSQRQAKFGKYFIN